VHSFSPSWFFFVFYWPGFFVTDAFYLLPPSFLSYLTVPHLLQLTGSQPASPSSHPPLSPIDGVKAKLPQGRQEVKNRELHRRRAKCYHALPIVKPPPQQPVRLKSPQSRRQGRSGTRRRWCQPRRGRQRIGTTHTSPLRRRQAERRACTTGPLTTSWSVQTWFLLFSFAHVPLMDNGMYSILCFSLYDDAPTKTFACLQ
jgi:hypothetical protein